MRCATSTPDCGPLAQEIAARSRAAFTHLHVSRGGRRGRHLILFRAGPEDTIEVLRILHDRMDIAGQVSVDSGNDLS
jgi:plasmid stabilization system protein ParE